MTDYYLVHDPVVLDTHIRPALGEAWRSRSFSACRRLAEFVAPFAETYLHRYHLAPDSLICTRMGTDLPFDRAIWRAVVGELLLVAAVEIPEFAGPLDPLTTIFPTTPIRQALHGCRPLTLGPIPYRPEHAGLNDAYDVARLADYLMSLPSSLSLPDTPSLAELDEDQRREEVLDAECAITFLQDLYCRSRKSGRLIVVERLV